MRQVLLCMFLFLFLSVKAQKSLIHKSSYQNTSVVQIDLPHLDNATLREEARAKRNGDLIFAHKIFQSVDCEKAGAWESIPGDKLLWKVRIRSQGAASLNMSFRKYVLPKNSTMVIYSYDKSQIIGPFTSYDNNTSGELWTPIIPSDDIIVELQIPAAEKKELQLEIGQINHGFDKFDAKTASESCNLDVVCGLEDGYALNDNYRDIMRSVGAYSIEGIKICTGALINNTKNDCTPYFLTANHCGVNAANAETVVIYWNFENSTCRTPSSAASGTTGDGPLSIMNSGTELISNYFDSDFMLLKLNDEVPIEADPYLAGWNRSSEPIDTAFSIHHPNVEEKRISYDYGTINAEEEYWVIDNWEVGSTQGGSSGAPLFNTKGQIVGQLFGGQATCGNGQFDNFGRLDVSWEGDGESIGRLSDWLDPIGNGVISIPGKSCSAVLSISDPVLRICPQNGNINSVILSVNNGFPEIAELGFEKETDKIQVVLQSTSISDGRAVVANIVTATDIEEGDYDIIFNAEDNSNNAVTFLTVRITNGTPGGIEIINPEDEGSMGEIVDFEWENSSEFYDFEISQNSNFSNPFGVANNINSNTFKVENLSQESNYFWRVRGINECGIGEWRESQFSTGKIVCTIYTATDLPQEIGQSENESVISLITVSDEFLVTDVNVMKVKGTHTFISDIQMRILSPSNTEVILLPQSCESERDFDIGFDDESANDNITCPLDLGMVFQPRNNLSKFNGENSKGDWKLQIIDLVAIDGGSFNEWSMELCVNTSKRIATTEEAIQAYITTYPNPASDILYIDQKENIKQPTYAIVDIAGRSLLTGQLQSQLDISSLDNGIYFLQVREENELVGIKKIVISK